MHKFTDQQSDVVKKLLNLINEVKTMLKRSILPMKLQYFAEEQPAEPTQQNSGASENGEQQSSAVDVEALQKRLANVTKQRDGLLAKQSTAQNSEAPASTSASSATPSSASSSNDDAIKQMQAQIKTLQEENNAQKAQINQSKQRSSFLAKGKKDGIELTDQDLQMINGSQDQDATYKYIKSLKANSNNRKYAPRANTFTRQKDNVGATLAKVDNSAKGLGALVSAQQEQKGLR